MATRRRLDPPAAQVLHDYEETFLDCRADGHLWRRIGFYRHAAGATVILRRRCQRCGTVRNNEWSLKGEYLGNRYDYPDGYRIPVVPVHAFDVRVESLRRATVYGSEAEMLTALGNNGAKRGGK